MFTVPKAISTNDSLVELTTLLIKAPSTQGAFFMPGPQTGRESFANGVVSLR